MRSRILKVGGVLKCRKVPALVRRIICGRRPLRGAPSTAACALPVVRVVGLEAQHQLALLQLKGHELVRVVRVIGQQVGCQILTCDFIHAHQLVGVPPLIKGLAAQINRPRATESELIQRQQIAVSRNDLGSVLQCNCSADSCRHCRRQTTACPEREGSCEILQHVPSQTYITGALDVSSTRNGTGVAAADTTRQRQLAACHFNSRSTCQRTRHRRRPPIDEHLTRARQGVDHVAAAGQGRVRIRIRR